jgi:hypothetical protein
LEEEWRESVVISFLSGCVCWCNGRVGDSLKIVVCGVYLNDRDAWTNGTFAAEHPEIVERLRKVLHDARQGNGTRPMRSGAASP